MEQNFEHKANGRRKSGWGDLIWKSAFLYFYAFQENINFDF